MKISSKALLLALENHLKPETPDPERFHALLDLSIGLFQADRAFLLVWTPEERFEFHSARFVDAATEGALERLGRALLREWARHPFQLFTPDSVTPEFAGGLLRKRPFRDQPFACLLLADVGQVLGFLFLEGRRTLEFLKSPDLRSLDLCQRLGVAFLKGELSYRRLSHGTQRLLEVLEKSDIEDLEKEGLAKALQRHSGNITRTHLSLGIPRMSFYQKMRRYRLKAQTYRRRIRNK